MIIIARDFRYVVNVSKINTVFERKKTVRIRNKSLDSVKYFDEYALSLEFDCKLNQ